MMPSFFHFRAVFWALLLLFNLSSYAAPGDKGKGKPAVEKISKVGQYQGYSDAEYKGYKYSSLYLTMRDSVMIATDVFLPKGLEAGEKVPTILYVTRYTRSLRAKWPLNWLKNPVLVVVNEKEVAYFTSHGYAVLIVDARGTGASSSRRTMEFSPEEVADGGQVVDWIVAQPWSNGKVGTSGISYGATTAEQLLLNQHPAVKACIPRSGILDLYSHIMFPGGVRQAQFIDIWGFTTRSLDQNDLSVFGKKAKRLIKGIQPVQGDKKKVHFKENIAVHKGNFDVYEGIQVVTCREDKHPEMSRSSNEYSTHYQIDRVANCGSGIYRIGGWYDGALTKSIIEGFWNTPNTDKVLIGPWDHGPADNASPWSPTTERGFDVYGEMLRYFDFYLKGIDNQVLNDDKFYYYTVGEEKWKSTNVWPPAYVANKTVYLSANNSLVNNSSTVQNGSNVYKVDYDANTDIHSRWNSLTTLYKSGPTTYGNRQAPSDKLLHYDFAPFDADVELTGSAIAHLFISCDTTNADVFVYIEDVHPDGKTVYMVTEGMLRGIHRKVGEDTDGYKQLGPYHSYTRADMQPMVPGQVTEFALDLLPISYQFKKGHSLRISIAGADKLHFDSPAEKPTVLELHCSPEYPSRVVLPLAGR
ncbi:CocE/NonD family hydrolase [soil metagenome]